MVLVGYCEKPYMKYKFENGKCVVAFNFVCGDSMSEEEADKLIERIKTEDLKAIIIKEGK